MRTLAIFLLLAGCLRAEDWTVNGKNYHNVIVGQIESDRVHVTYDGGVGAINLADLPPDLQMRFRYDPIAAKAAQTKREADQKAVNAQLAANAKQQPQTFEEKVEAAKAAKRAAIEQDLKSCRIFLEQTKVDMAASSSEPYRVANLKTLADYYQKEIDQDQARLANMQ